MDSQKLQDTIAYQFKVPAHLQEALTHPSLTHENGAPAVQHNQRLEFLGDAVLQMILTDRIYELYPDHPEGKLTQTRAHLANRHSLYRHAQTIELGKYLLLGKGEATNGGRTRLSNLADAYEALLGAIYLDGGMRAARKFILTQFAEDFTNLEESTPRQNPKGLLQELLQARAPVNPIYRVTQESGPDHDKHFVVTVEWCGDEIGRGEGASKKQAETAAAEAALAKLTSISEPVAATPPPTSPATKTTRSR